MRRTAPGPQLLAKQTDLKFGDSSLVYGNYVFGIFGASLLSLTQLIETLGA